MKTVKILTLIPIILGSLIVLTGCSLFGSSDNDIDVSNGEYNSGNALNGEYIWEAAPGVFYKFNLMDGIPQPMGTSQEYDTMHNRQVTETIMAYMMGGGGGTSDEWEVAPHYWAALRCTDCPGTYTGYEEMPEWFRHRFSHAWSGEWENETPKVFSEPTVFSAND